MRLIDHYQKFCETLVGVYSISETNDLFKRLLFGFFEWEPTILGLSPDKILDAQQIQQLDDALLRLQKNEPVQYIIGKTYFRDLKLIISPATLIPRPETEELVEWIISDFDTSAPKSILDVGTGSGCIALALQNNFSKATITAIDKSAAALAVAQKNATLLDLPVRFEHHAIEQLPLPDVPFDLIVSNPPYVHRDENIAPNVRDYEPHMALFAPQENPIYFYEQIAAYGKKALKSGGVLYFEINPLDRKELMKMLLKNDYVHPEIRSDIFGNFRFLKAIKT